MSSRSTQRGFLVLWIVGLAVLSVRPVGVVERGLDLALLPVRLLSEAARPVGWLRRSSVAAAEERLESRMEDDFGRRQQLFRDSAVAALPDPRAFPARRFVLAEVIDREAGRIDRVVIRLESDSTEGIVRGLPVVSGEVFVGRIERVDPGAGQAVVALITGRDTFVGARLAPDDPEQASVRMVVGGVLQARAPSEEEDGPPASGAVVPDRYLLAVHNPSRRALSPGLVVVDEGLDGERLDALADGFLLGRPVVNGGDPRRPSYGIEPQLDYRTGLFQLVVVAPQDLVRDPEQAALDVLEDPDAWREVEVTASADPAAWREGVKLDAGWWNGLASGAAVVSGSHLVGRVKRASPISSDVALLGDPGFHIPALARVEGRATPLVLGSLVTLGRDPDGAHVRFLWNARAPRTVERATRAEIFTGSGEPRVPRGLLLGVTELPAGEGLHELDVEQPVDTREVQSLWVRIDAPAGAGGGRP